MSRMPVAENATAPMWEINFSSPVPPGDEFESGRITVQGGGAAHFPTVITDGFALAIRDLVASFSEVQFIDVTVSGEVTTIERVLADEGGA